jgi:hypothetical protein
VGHFFHILCAKIWHYLDLKVVDIGKVSILAKRFEADKRN